MGKLLQLLLIKKLKDKAEKGNSSVKDLDLNTKHSDSSMGQGVQNLFDKIASKFKGPQLGNKENQLEKQFSDKQTVQILQTQTNKLDDINKTLIENQIKNDKHFKELIERGGVGGGGGKSGGGWLKSILGGAGLFGASKLMAGGTAATATAASPGLLAKGGGLLAKAGKFALPSLGLGLLGVGAKYGLDRLGDKAIIAGNEKTGKALKVGGEMAKYAGFGAGIGRFAGPVGMAIGGGVGALVGAGKGIYRNVFSQEQRDNWDKGTTNEKMLGFNMGKNDMLSAAAWGKDKKESTTESRVRSSQTFKQASLYQADEDLYNEFNDRKKELEKKEYEKIISQYKNPTAHNELIARQQASGRATSQAMDEFAIRAEKVGASTIHEGRDYFKEQEEAYLNRNKGEEKKEEKQNFFTRMKDKIKYAIDKAKFNYNAGMGLNLDKDGKITSEEYYNPDIGAKTLPDMRIKAGTESRNRYETQYSTDGSERSFEKLKEISQGGSVQNKIIGDDKNAETRASWLSKKGTSIGAVDLDSYKEDHVMGDDVIQGSSAGMSEISAERTSGGLFSPDKYQINMRTRDEDPEDLRCGYRVEPDNPLELNKEQYMHLQSLAKENKSEEAQAYVDKLMNEQRNPKPSIFGKISNAFTDFFKGGKTDGVGATYKSDSADLLEKQYAEIKAAELEKQYKSSNIVNAPTTTNVSNQNSSNIVKSSPQNEESSISKYIGSLWSM